MRILRMVVIEAPAFFMDDPIVRDLYTKMIRLKIEGYETLESGYKAYDETDLFATHHLVCEETIEGLEPLIGFKSMTTRWCNQWDLEFYGTRSIQESGSLQHYKAIKNFAEYCNQRDGNFGYTASLAIWPGVRKDRGLQVECLRMFECMLSHFHVSFDVKRSTCIGRIKTGAPKVLARVGYEPIKLEGQKLEKLNVSKYENDYMLLVLNNVSDEGRALIATYAEHWKRRLHFDWRESSRSHRCTDYHHYKSMRA